MQKLFQLISSAKAIGNLPNITPPNAPLSKFEGTGLEGLMMSALDWVLWIATALLVVAIVYSGVMYITSGGDPTKAETAKKNLIWAIIGLVILLLLNLIIHWVQVILTTAP